MARIAIALCLVMLLALFPSRTEAQAKEIAELTKGTWIIEGEIIDPYVYKDSCIGRDDSTFYQFQRAEKSCSGFPDMPAVLGRRWNYINNPISDSLELSRSSCPDYFGFLGNKMGRTFYLVICGEHWPYIAQFEMRSDSTFMLTSDFGYDQLSTRYYRRIPTPEILRRQ